MVVNSPLNGMEDQTDEDFFDKLVEDDFRPTPSSRILEEESDSDEAKAFANLAVEETDGEILTSVPKLSNSTAVLENICSASDSETVGKSITNNEVSVETCRDSTAIVSGENSSSGVKEIGWGSFQTDLSLTRNQQPDSESDFFDHTGGNSEDFFEKLDEIGTIDDSNYGTLNNGNHFSVQGESETSIASEQDSNDHHSLDEKYPGWKFDSSSGQWYQVDSFEVNNVVSESVYADQKDENTGIGSLQQSTTSLEADTSVNHNAYSWNQISETKNNGYPEHMYFDPQYPGWYYDMLTQTWNTLESYTLSLQSTAMNLQDPRPHNDSSYNCYAHDQQATYSNQGYYDFGQSNTISQNHYVEDRQPAGWNNANNDSLDNSATKFWQPETAGRVGQLSPDTHATTSFSNAGHQTSAYYQNVSQGNVASNGFISSANFDPQPMQHNANQMVSANFSNYSYTDQNSLSSAQLLGLSSSQFSYNPSSRFSSDGRPPHTLATFGFGGKLLIMKDSSCNASFSAQESKSGTVSVYNLMEVALESTAKPSSNDRVQNSYFRTLSLQSFPGPLVGGSVGNKELSKWIDDRISGCDSSDVGYGKDESLKLLFSLLKIAFQHYGKLRSSFGADASSRDNDSPETAVARLFASVRNNGSRLNNGSFGHCLQKLPSENQIQTMAAEVQNYLVSGKTVEALKCAQQGHLWGPALVLASQLGNQYYVDTVKQMALHQLVPGSPLRTLCLLIAGEPREVFSSGPSTNLSPNGFTPSQCSTQNESNVVLGDWEENLAVIAANRTKDDEFVIVHLGDCLWKDRSEILAAHICYLVAETNFEQYSNSARLCLIGADHLKHPRSFASPEAIQRTEFFEYSKVTGNSQFVLQPFQPYKLIYAHMLAEVGKLSDSLKYCHAVLKLLKTSRSPEAETWRQLASSLEERLKIHQQGGYGTNLAPAKLVGKLLNFFDSTAHRVVGGLPPPIPSSSQGNNLHNENVHSSSMINRVPATQSTMAMSSLIPSASMEPISEWNSDDSRKIIHSRSVSEPDFGRTPTQVAPSKEDTTTASGKGSNFGSSRFTRLGFGSQLLQKTVSLVLKPKSDKQAKLGEKNKFYYDEKLKRWVEEGAEVAMEPSPPLQPPTSFQNGTADYNLKSALKSDESQANGASPSNNPSLVEQTSGVPPLSVSSNQFSARRTGVRSRYVDTFNKGVATMAGSTFSSPSPPPAKPSVAANTHFFVPSPSPTAEPSMEAVAETLQEDTVKMENSYSYPTSESAGAGSMQRFPSMENMSRKASTNESMSPLQVQSRRTASWSGSFNDFLTPPAAGNTAIPSASFSSPVNSMPALPVIGNGFRDDLQEVEF